MHVNPGFMTLIVILVIVILLLSGWKDYFFQGLSFRSIVIFMSGWLICSTLNLRLPITRLDIYINIVYLYLLVFIGYLMSKISLKSVLELLNLITGCLIICFLDFTFREVLALHIEYSAIFLALAAVGLQKKAMKQLVCLLLGLLGGNLVSILVQNQSQMISMADQHYQDLWWLTLLLWRLLTVLFENSVIQIRRWYSGIFVKK